MPEKGSPHSRRHSTSVAYEKSTGSVVFVHHTELMAGGIAPDRSKIERLTLRLASKATG
jgi:hypothetical protein